MKLIRKIFKLTLLVLLQMHSDSVFARADAGRSPFFSLGERYYCPPACKDERSHFRGSGIKYQDQSSNDPDFPPVYIAACTLYGSEGDLRACRGSLDNQCYANEITNFRRWTIQQVPVPIYATCSPNMFRPVVFSPISEFEVRPAQALGPEISKARLEISRIFAPSFGLTIIILSPSGYGVDVNGVLIGTAPSVAGTYPMVVRAVSGNGSVETTFNIVVKP